MECLLCTLGGNNPNQYNLSLVFGYDVPVEFYTKGKSDATMYLSGYFQPGPENDDDSMEDEDDMYDMDDMDEEAGDYDDESSSEDEENIGLYRAIASRAGDREDVMLGELEDK